MTLQTAYPNPNDTVTPAGFLPTAYGETQNSSELGLAYGGLYAAMRLVFNDSGLPFDPLITFTRASNATYFDSTGTLQTAGSGVARSNAYQDHNPATLAPLGFLIEEQRTNSIRNNTMVGASAPSTKPTNWTEFTNVTGLTLSVAAPTTENGIACVDITIAGTPSGAGVYDISYEAATQIAASNGQTWAHATYYKLQGGTTSGISAFRNRIAYRDAASELTTVEQTFTPTSAALRTQRVTAAGAASNAGTLYALPYLRLTLSGAAVNITLRIGLPQLELGAFATSPILTTTAAATRLADVASITGTAFSSFYNAVEGTWRMKYMNAATSPAAVVVQIQKDTTGFDQYLVRDGSALGGSPGSNDLSIRSGNVSQMDSAGPVTTINTLYTTAFRYKVNDCAICTGGGTVFSDTSVTLPVGIVQLQIGSNGAGGNFRNGWMQDLAFYNRAFADATIQSLTV